MDNFGNTFSNAQIALLVGISVILIMVMAIFQQPEARHVYIVQGYNQPSAL